MKQIWTVLHGTPVPRLAQCARLVLLAAFMQPAVAGAAPLPPVQAVAAGGYHALALAKDGTVWAWGMNDNGQLGDGTTEERHAPMPVPGLSAISNGYLRGVYMIVRDATRREQLPSVAKVA